MVPVIRDAGPHVVHRLQGRVRRRSSPRRARTSSPPTTSPARTSRSPTRAASARSPRVPRLMVGQGTIVATGSIAYPVGLGNIGAMIGAEKVMTMTSTYDHRIIQGAESGRFLQRVEAVPPGRARLLRGRLRVARRRARPAAVAAGPRRRRGRRRRAAPARRARARRGRRGAACRPSRPRRRSSRRTARTATSPRSSTRSAIEPEGDPALDPEQVGLTPELMARIPAKILRVYVPGATLADALPHLRETYCGTIAYEIEHISSHRQRVWLRENIESGTFRKPLTTDEQKWLLGRLIKVDAFERFIHKAYLGPEAVLDRGPRHDRADARRADPALGRARRPRGRRRHGAPRPAQRARPQPRPPVRHDLRRVRGRLDARGRHDDPAGRHRRRQVPPRRAGLLPAAQRRVDPRQPRVEPVAPRVRRPGRGRRDARRADDAPGPARPPGHRAPRCRSCCTATRRSPARASSRRRSTSRRSTATRSAARST